MSVHAVVDAGGRVVNAIEYDGQGSLGLARGMTLVDTAGAPAVPGIGWTYSGGAFVPPTGPLAPPVDLLAYAAARRYAVETGGIVVAGVPVATDDRSKTMIMGARIAATADSGFATTWVATDGTVYPLVAGTIVAISDAVLAHVNACFAAYAAVAAQIASGAISSVEEVEAASWPANA